MYGALSAGLHALPAPLRSLSLDITALPEAHDLPQPAAWMALTQLRMLDASWQHGKICRWARLLAAWGAPWCHPLGSPRRSSQAPCLPSLSLLSDAPWQLLGDASLLVPVPVLNLAGPAR